MEIIRSADGIFNKKSNGTDVIYYIFNEYEIHFNIISGNSIQEWHRHELLEEVIYVLFGSICIHWVEDDECKSITISKGDIARVEKNIHTLENDKNEAAEFLVFRLILDGIDKKTLIKNDKILVNEDPCKNEKKYKSIVSVPGRVCFAGEDIDWMSGPSILGAVDLRTRVEIEPISTNIEHIEIKSGFPFDQKMVINISELSSYGDHKLRYCQAAVQVISKMGIEIIPIKISVSSTLPAMAGLSSSAAVTVASLGALNDYFELDLSPYEICELAYAVESDELNTGAGQMDFYPCGLGGVIYLDSSSKPPNPIIPYKIPHECSLIIADTLTPRFTQDVIASKRKRFINKEKNILEYKRLTEMAINELKLKLENKASLEELGRIINQCHIYLDDFMQVSTQLLNKCVNKCLKIGAYGAKLTGTGMGGCMFALVPSNKVKEISQSLQTLPVKVYQTSISNEGLKYIN